MGRYTIVIAAAAALFLFAWLAGARVTSEGKLKDSDDDRIFSSHKHEGVNAHREGATAATTGPFILKVRVFEGATDADSETLIDTSVI